MFLVGGEEMARALLAGEGSWFLNEGMNYTHYQRLLLFPESSPSLLTQNSQNRCLVLVNGE